MRPRSLPILLALALAVTAAWLSPARGDAPLTEQDVERIVRDYLMREPQIILEAVEELQRRQQAEESERRREAILALAEELFHDPQAPVLGNPEGDVTLVEFMDYRCGFCRRMVPALQRLLADDPGLRVVMKEFPILGEDSVRAARAALAAEAQGGYEDIHFALMAADDLSLDGILDLAGRIGLDAERLRADMGAAWIDEHIRDNYRLARALGIEGTPAFVIADRLLPGAVELSQLEALIEEARGD